MDMQSRSHEEKFLGGMVGSALGDAIGEMAFRCRSKRRLAAFIEQADELRYTDDTAMALGLAESLIRMKGVDEKDLGETFCRNYEQEPWRGYGPGPPRIFARVKRNGISYSEAARDLYGGEGSLGNGAAMRIVPVGLLFQDSDRCYEAACASARVTHTHPVGMDGAAVLALAVAAAARSDPKEAFSAKDFIGDLATRARTPEIRQKMEQVGVMLEEDPGPGVAVRVLGRSVAVHQSMPFALYSFLRHPRSFEDCLFCAVCNGGDRDTLGAMACAVSGAYMGIEAIPERWRIKLENLQKIERLASSLAQLKIT